MKRIIVPIALLALFGTHAIAQQATPPAKTETTKVAKHHKKKKHHRENGTMGASEANTPTPKVGTDMQPATGKKTAPTY